MIEDDENSVWTPYDEIKEAAERVLAEVERPVGKIHEMKLPDTQASRQALLALSDAIGRVIP